MSGKRFWALVACSTVECEASLFARAQEGDETAFQALFDVHRSRVYSLCLRMTGSTADAEDLTQEACLKVFRKISTFRGTSAFSTWLYRLAKNEVLMHLRKNRLPQVSQYKIPCKKNLSHDYPDDNRRLLGTFDRLNLNQAIAQLPSGYQTPVPLFELERYKHKEIAQMMNWSVGNSKAQIHKARRKLREWLTPVCGEGFSCEPSEGRLNDERLEQSGLERRAQKLTEPISSRTSM
jgi:RNA polymerase sigma-70 factor, ECF subfamily